MGKVKDQNTGNTFNPQSSDLSGQLAVVIGAGGGLGGAVAGTLVQHGYTVVTASRSAEAPCGQVFKHVTCHYTDEDIAKLAASVSALANTHGLNLQRLVICNGVLHDQHIRPERSIKRLQRQVMLEVIETNTVVPALCLGAFTPMLTAACDPKVAVFSARVGSIGDNGLGGWHSYRASKAALNMLLKCAAIELHRLNPTAAVMAFHPGTVDTPMSKPFQRGLPEGKLLRPDVVATCLSELLNELPASQELKYVDWRGDSIVW